MDAIFEYLGSFPTWIQTGVGLFFATTLIGVINKSIHKDKLLKITNPAAKAVGMFLNVLLLRLFGAENAQKLENGMFDTLCTIGEEFFKSIRTAMFADNKKKVKK